jgi:hypothetical protein
MGMDVVGDEDIEGDDEDISGEEYVVGRGRSMRHALARRASHIKLRLPNSLRGVTTQGVSRPKEELDFLPFRLVTAIPTGVLAAGFSTSLEAFPQRPFRGERLIITAALTNAGVTTNVDHVVVISPAMFVGAVQVGASQGDVPLAAFAATAFGVRLAIPPAGQGTRILIPIILRFAQVAGDSTTVTATMIGRAVR